jgi:uncharacterized membrane protein
VSFGLAAGAIPPVDFMLLATKGSLFATWQALPTRSRARIKRTRTHDFAFAFRVSPPLLLSGTTTKFGMKKTGNLFVIGFDEPNQAEEVHFKLQKLQSESIVDLADVAIAVKDETGKAMLHRAGKLWGEGAALQGFFGSLANLIFTNATVAASGALADVGITDRFMKELATVVIPSRSALFVLTRRPTSDKDRVLEELKGLGGKIFTTSLSHEDEARLQAALNATKSKT